MKYTLGEWVSQKTSHDILIYSEADRRSKTIAVVYGDDEGAKANAMLIKAAPKMLNFLFEALTIFSANCDCNQCGPCRFAKQIEELVTEIRGN